MPASIAFSNDMNDLIFTDGSGNFAEFDLTTSQGAKVYIDTGVLKAVQGPSSITGGTTTTISTTNNQWQITYNDTEDAVFIVGTNDIDDWVTNPKSSMQGWGMSGGTELVIKRVGSDLKITEL